MRCSTSPTPWRALCILGTGWHSSGSIWGGRYRISTISVAYRKNKRPFAPRHPAQRAALVATPHPWRSVAWTCRSGWVTVEPRGFSGATASQRPVLERWGRLKELPESFGITSSYTDGWGACERHSAPEQHTIGTAHTRKIESHHSNVRTRIKRLVRRPLCFSKTTTMHDRVISLFINRYEFGRSI